MKTQKRRTDKLFSLVCLLHVNRVAISIRRANSYFGRCYGVPEFAYIIWWIAKIKDTGPIALILHPPLCESLCVGKGKCYSLELN